MGLNVQEEITLTIRRMYRQSLRGEVSEVVETMTADAYQRHTNARR